MRKVALKVGYIGTDYHGFQRQPNFITVEGELIKALRETGLIENLKDSGYAIAGRTDRGVHALGNVISFRTPEKVVLNQINDCLPKNIRILAKAGVPFGFKPRYAKSRHYRYVIVNGNNLNVNEMRKVSSMFQGAHDFSNFSKRSERNPVRTIDSIEISEVEDIIIIDIIGESFLWNMVRKIASVLFSAGNNELNLNEIENLFDPLFTASIAPMQPEGLILMDTIYANINFKTDDYARNKFLSTLNEEFKYNRTISAAEKAMINKLINHD